MEKVQNYDEKNWASPAIMEARFWHDGMTPEEYEIEYANYGFFLYDHPERLTEYVPLWKQKELGMSEYEDNVNRAVELRKAHLGY